MSIRSIQTAQVLDEVANALYASGVNPTLDQVMGQVSKFFTQYPVGQPLTMPYDYIQSNLASDADKFNLLMLHLAMNLDVAYQACLEQVNQILVLTQLIQSYLNRLTRKRNQLLTQVDDYLLTLSNTDGYFYSTSDAFADTSNTDLTLTSAFVDTSIGAVTLPTLSSLSKIVDPSDIGTPSVTVTMGGAPLSFTTVSPFSFSTNGLSNTVWEIQATTPVQGEVIAQVVIPLGTPQSTVQISELDFTPYGVVPVQILAETGTLLQTSSAFAYTQLGNNIQTTTDAVTFLAGQSTEVDSIRLTLRKTQADYIKSTSTFGPQQYVYVFGAKNIVLIEQVYDNEATWVTVPLTIPSDLSQDMVIDAVSLSAITTVPANTNIKFSVALDPGNTTQISDFNWQPISPIGSQAANTIVDFSGAEAFISYIRSNPVTGELQLLPADNSNSNLSQRNPSPVIIPTIDIWRLIEFTDTPLLNSIKLEEGINTTRIYSTAYDKTAVANLDFWGNEVATGTPTIQYGRIDAGHGFFYGGDIGENGKSVYVETYLNLPGPLEPILDTFQKVDQNSQTWDVRIYLNGAEIGWLPGRNSDATEAPVDNLVIPWNFNGGQNHIALAVNIPPLTAVTGVANPYIGTLGLMNNHNLYQFGTVKLADWSYVDFFDLQYNTVGTPPTFTIYNGEIISRRQPTANYRLSYNKPSNNTIPAVRLRADLSRDNTNMHITPQLNSYRLRFQYGNS